MQRYPLRKEIFNMKDSTVKILTELISRYPVLKGERDDILKAFDYINESYKRNGKLLICGNGGSAADSEHIVGELMKKFKKPRAIKKDVYEKLKEYGKEGELLCKTLEGSLRAISLTSHISLSTAFSNDKNPSVVFAQQLYGLADSGDVLLTISTSGNSENCVLAAITAKAMGLKIVSFTGQKESKLSKISDITIRVPETETYKVQELHLPIYHCLCAMLEEESF